MIGGIFFGETYFGGITHFGDIGFLSGSVSLYPALEARMDISLALSASLEFGPALTATLEIEP